MKYKPKTDKGFEQQALHKAIGTLLSGYTKGIHKQEGTKGSLFRSKTKAKDGWIDGFITQNGKHQDLMFRRDNDYAVQCFHYIHENAVKAGLCVLTTDWPYSSARDYAALRNGTLCNQALAKELLFS